MTMTEDISPDELLQLSQLQLSVEIVRHSSDHPAHAGADGSVVVAADLVPVVPQPVPSQVATDQVPENR